jgi:hypothetical protein
MQVSLQTGFCTFWSNAALTERVALAILLDAVRHLNARAMLWADERGELHKMEALSPREWLQRHTSMTDEDLIKNPTRNRLNILLSRARHVSYHLGQVALARN